jgi:hypothetical protein
VVILEPGKRYSWTEFGKVRDVTVSHSNHVFVYFSDGTRISCARWAIEAWAGRLRYSHETMRFAGK